MSENLMALTHNLNGLLSDEIQRAACHFVVDLGNSRTAREARQAALVMRRRIGMARMPLAPIDAAPWYGWARIAWTWLLAAASEKDGTDPQEYIDAVAELRELQSRARMTTGARRVSGRTPVLAEFVCHRRSAAEVEKRLTRYAEQHTLVPAVKADIAARLRSLRAPQAAQPMELAALGGALFFDGCASYRGSRKDYTYQSKFGLCIKDDCGKFFFRPSSRGCGPGNGFPKYCCDKHGQRVREARHRMMPGRKAQVE